MEGSHDEEEVLPNDVVAECLSRVPLKWLHQCRRVCRQWHDLTGESWFIRLHRERTQTISGYFVQSMVTNKSVVTFVSLYHPSSPSSTSPPVAALPPPPTLNFLPEDVKIEASSCHGLLCCTSQGDVNTRYYVCKPSTLEWKRIPNPRTRYSTVKTSMLVGPLDCLDYKIVRFSRPRRMPVRGYLICEIFDSRRWAWRRAADVPWLPGLFGREPGVVLGGGVLHWFTATGVFAFNAFEESWKTIPLPEALNGGGDDEEGEERVVNEIRRLVKYEDKLSLVCIEPEWMDIWVLTKYSRETWEYRGRWNLETIHTEEPLSSMGDLYTSEVALMRSFYNIVWFDLEKGKKVKSDACCGPAGDIFRFESDLVPCDMANRRLGL